MADSAFHAIRRGGYTNVDNDVFHAGLSARAIGILVIMLSKPLSWRFAAERLADEVKEGRDAVRATLRELEAAGFVKRRTVGGTEPHTDVYVRDSRSEHWPWEEPQVSSNDWKPATGKSATGNSGLKVTTEEVTTEKEIHAQSAIERECFERFWSIYPRRVKKKTAQAVFHSVFKETTFEEVFSALRARVEWWSRMRTPMTKIPYPTTWLNAAQWTDEIEPVEVPASQRASHEERFAAAAEVADRLGGRSIFDVMAESASTPQTKELTA